MVERKKLIVIGGGFIILFGFITVISTVFPWHKSVTISSKNWECVSSDTVGLEARCTSYRMVPTPFVHQ